MITLQKAITNTDITLMISNDGDLPESGVIQLEDEIIAYKERFKKTLYGCSRGIQGSTAVSHEIGSIISLRDLFSAELSLASFPITAPDGTALAPSFAFTDDVLMDTGLYRIEEDTIAIACGGINSAYFNTGGMVLQTGQSILFQNGTRLSGDTFVGLSLEDGPAGLYGHGVLQLGSHPSAATAITINNSIPIMTFRLNGSVIGLQLGVPENAGETGLFLYDFDTSQLQPVLVGAADSGGLGYRMLRIPN